MTVTPAQNLVKRSLLVVCIVLLIVLLVGSVVAAWAQSENIIVSPINQPLEKIEFNNFALLKEKLFDTDNFIQESLSKSSYLARQKTVYVKQYHRKDGTSVRSHYRRSPR